MTSRPTRKFAELYAKYFPGAELPIAFFYAAAPPAGTVAEPPAKGWRCVIGDLNRARRGETLCLDEKALGCGKRFCGFRVPQRPDFEFFLSCGIPGKMAGERYKKSPEIVRRLIQDWPEWQAPAKYLVVKRWDRLDETDEPEAAVFFAKPDVLSGLFTLANFEQTDPHGVIAPFASGCASVIQYPFLENRKGSPRCVLGLFDVSARPCLEAGVLTFAVPMKKLERMIADMEESFLITGSWEKVKRRLQDKA